jgi:hypothetical protein
METDGRDSLFSFFSRVNRYVACGIFAVLCDLVGGQNGPKKNVDETFWQKP